MCKRNRAFFMTIVLALAFSLFAGFVSAEAEIDEADNRRHVKSSETFDISIDANEILMDAFYGNSVQASATHPDFSPFDQALYRALKEEITKIANGERTDTKIEIHLDNVLDKPMTAEELGVSEMLAEDGNHLSQEAREKLYDLAGSVTPRLILRALRFDCPYELYWAQSSISVAGGTWGVSYTMVDGVPLGIVDADFTFFFYVSDDYRIGDYFTVDPNKTARVKPAIENAHAIIAECAKLNDWDKLFALADAICARNVYNHYAADKENNVPYGDPWQLIYVFDGDPETNVVCEGYARAFQYLCDMSTFSDVSVITVHGIAGGPNSEGPHAWNVVCYNGTNYLADVTNSDRGRGDSVTNDFFMIQPDFGTAKDGYVVVYDPEYSAQKIAFRYQSGMFSLYSEEELTFAGVPISDGSSSGTVNSDIFWEIEDGVLTLSGQGKLPNYTASYHAPWYNKYFHTLIIGEQIATISEYAFDGSSALHTVNLGNVSSIANCAFLNCQNLETVTIPDTVTKVEPNAFCGCIGLIEVYMPDSVKELGIAAFGNCDSLEKVRLSNALTVIPEHLFSGCISLPEIILPESITEIKRMAFWHCTSLKKINIPESVTSIGDGAFGNNTPLELVRIPENCTQFQDAFFSSGVEEVILPSWIEAIDDQLFFSCTKLKRIVIPETVTRIGEEAFLECNSLQELVIPQSVTSIGERAFYGSGLVDVVIPDSVTEIGRYAFVFSYSLKSVIFPKHLCTISEGMFEHCYSLTEITFPEDLTEIEFGVFENCTSLTEFNVPVGVTTLGSYVFENCTNLTALTIPETVTEIGSFLVKGCSQLKRLVLPRSLSFMWNISFAESNLDDIVFLGDAPEAPDWEQAFGGPFGTTTATIHFDLNSNGWWGIAGQDCGGELTWVAEHNINCCAIGYEQIPIEGQPDKFRCSVCGEVADVHTAISPIIASGICGENARWAINEAGRLTISGSGAINNFEYNTVPWHIYESKVTEIVVKPGITAIGNQAFRFCYYATKATIPDTVTRLGDYSFIGCSSLTEIELSDQLTSIGRSCFAQCHALKSIEIPDGIVELPESCFEMCSELTTVILPSSICAIGDNCFAYDYSLAELVLPAQLEALGSNALVKTSIQFIEIPNRITELREHCFSGCSELEAVILPSSVRTIGASCFSNCDKLQSIVFWGNAPQIGNYAFDWVNATAFYNPNTSGWTDELKQRFGENLTWGLACLPANYSVLRLPEAVVQVEAESFIGVKADAIVVPENVKSLGSRAFAGASALKMLAFAGDPEVISTDILAGCKNVQILCLPGSEHVTSWAEQMGYPVVLWYGNGT